MIIQYRLSSSGKEGIIFHTATSKDLYKQLEQNPNAELCFNDLQKGIQIRVKGILTEIKDTTLKDEIVTHPSRDFLRDWKNNGELSDFYNNFAVFCMKNGEATEWTMNKNFTYPKTIVLL